MYQLEEEELIKLNSLQYDENLKPNFEEIKYCLVWNDELTDGIRWEVRELLYDLIIYRGLIHRQIPPQEWPGNDPKYFQDAWDFGLKNIPSWPGFKRINLSKQDEEYLQDCVNSGDMVI